MQTPFQFRQHLRQDTVNQPLKVLQFAFQLCPFHAVFHLAAFAGSGSRFQLLIFFQQVIDCGLIFLQLPGEILHLRKSLFQHSEGFLFLLFGVQRGNAVQRSFNGSCLFGEIDRLLEKPGGDMLPACLAGTLPTLQIRVFFYHVGMKIVLPLRQIRPVADNLLSAQAVVFRQRNKG